MLVDSWADLETVAASNAARQRVAHFLGGRGHSRAFAERIGAVDRNPAFCALEALEHEVAIDYKIAHEREFCKGLEADRFREIVHERGAGLARLAVDEHRARPANFLEAIRVVAYGRGFFAFAGVGLFSNIAEALNHVHVRAVAKFVFFPANGFVGALLPLDPD